ncbi:hypothetical protein ACFL3U_07170 [Pseudomonadota bacterium]
MNYKNQYIFALITLIIGLIISQNVIGAEDSTQDCRKCHDDYKNQPLLKASNPDIHHFLYDTEIVNPATPSSESDAGGRYDCFTCHNIIAINGGFTDTLTKRDCLHCHYKHSGSGATETRHHYLMDASGDLTCFDCHIQGPSDK